MKTIYITAIAAAALVLSGCNRDEIVPGASGDGYLKLEVAGVQTVTAVKGALYNSEKEMLDGGLKEFTVQAWNADCSPFVTEQPATYDDDSKWSLTPPVQWTGEDTKTFFAYANLRGGATVTNTFKSDDKSQKLEITSLPTDARQQNDIMLGYYSGDGKVDGKDAHTAQIQFYHPLTAVKICDGGIFVKAINRITLSGIYASGTVTVTYKPGGDGKIAPEYEWGSRTGKAAPTLEPKSGEEFEIDPVTKVIGVPFVVIPQDVAAGKVRITLDVTVNDDESKTLAVDVPATTWTAGHTKSYILSYGSETSYALSVTEWDENAAGDIELDDKDYQYEFKVADNHIVFSNTTAAQTKTFDIVSYRHEKGDDIIANREPVAYSAEYSLDGSKWFPFDDAAVTATGLTGLMPTGNAGAVKETKVSLTAPLRTIVEEETTQLYRWKDDTYSAQNVDLSRMQIGGEGDGTLQRNTANCYIVKHPGTYILPCVYGNAIQNGVETDNSYRTAQTNDYVLSSFLNSRGNAITNAWVLKDLAAEAINPKATLMWTDTKNNGELLVHDVQLVNESGAAFSFGADAGDAAYIKFTTADKDNMSHGNAVVVLYDDNDSDGSYDEGEALWSWQLWMTDADLSDQNVGVVGGVSFMSRNLGWCDGTSSKRYSVDETLQRIYIRLTQNNSASSLNLIVMQPDAFQYTACGNNTYYQWGRKDPFPGSESGTVTEKTFYDADGTALTLLTGTTTLFPGTKETNSSVKQANTVITNSIKNPRTYVTNYVNDGHYRNLWALDNTGNGESNDEIKTVYDPCPYGYVMPNSTHIHVVTKSASLMKWQTNPNGFLYNENDNLFFPVNGYRTYASGQIQDINDGRFNTSSTTTVITVYRLYIHKPGTDNNGITGQQDKSNKSNGYSVRPILEQ